MIILDLPDSINKTTSNEVVQEGVKDFIDNAKETVIDFTDTKLGMDTDKIRKEWDDDGDDVAKKATTVGRTATNAAKNMEDALDDILNKGGVDGRSIIARARNSVMQFPIYVTNTIRAAEAHTIAQLFGKVYASFVQAVIAQDPILDEHDSHNLAFLKKIHSNIRESAERLINEYYEPIDNFDSIMQDSIMYREQISDKCMMECTVITKDELDAKTVLVENARLINEPLTGLPYLYYSEASSTGDSVKVTTNSKIITVKEDELEELARHRLNDTDSRYVDMSNDDIKRRVDTKYPFPDEPDGNASQQDKYAYGNKCREVREQRKKFMENEFKRRDTAKEHLKDSVAQVKRDIRDGKFNNDKNGRYYYDPKTKKYCRNDISSSKSNREPSATPVNKAPEIPQLLRTTDVKKINGMDPYLMKVSFLIKDENGGVNNEVNYVIGIKTVMHMIYAQDLADELNDLITGSSKALQKVRYKTGEIKFLDYMFNIKSLKSDAAKNINYNKKWITTLKRLASFNKTHGTLLKKPTELLNGGNIPYPNATLILSQTDVTMLVNKTGIDLSKVSNAKRLMKNLFLIAIAVVDSSAGTMRVLLDQDSDWDVQSLASIDAEVAKTDNSQLMKELNKMVNR